MDPKEDPYDPKEGRVWEAEAGKQRGIHSTKLRPKGGLPLGSLLLR